jgi:hypothetical protein
MNVAGAVAFLLGTILPLAALAFVLVGLWGRDPEMDEP